MNKVLVTGPDGFVGYRLCERLMSDGLALRGAQLEMRPLPDGCESVVVGDLAAATNWDEALCGVDRVLHLAARVHVMHDDSLNPLQEFRRVNVEGTRAVVAAALRAGVKRFILISTVKVLGELSPDKPFHADDPYAPEDPYGVSKMEAEQLLMDTAQSSGMEMTIIRPTLVYGPGVRANFLRLLNTVHRGVPLPLGLVNNLRSLVGVDNLIDLMAVCLSHPNAANERFMVSDGHDLSTPELVRMMASAMGRRSRLVPCPTALMRMAGGMLGRGDSVARLLESLTVDIAKNKELLQWSPPYSVEDQMQKTAAWFLSMHRKRG